MFRATDRPPFRSHFGAALHVPPGESDPYAYIVQGYNVSPARQFHDVLRTRDFLKVERAYRPGLPNWAWGGVASFQNKLIRGPGFDGGYPASLAYGDQVTGTLYASDDGNGFVALPASPAAPAEVGLFVVNGAGTKLLHGMGVRYEEASTPGQPWTSGSYVHRNPRAVYALLSDLATYELRTADCGFRRRSFAQITMPNGLIAIHGGIDDEVGQPLVGTIVNEMWTSADDGATWVNRGPMDFGTIMGHDFVLFKNRLGSLGGRYGDSNFSASVWTTDNLSQPWLGWTRHHGYDTPFVAAVGSKPIVMTVNGAETLFVYGGAQTGGSAPSTMRMGLWATTEWNGPWVEMRGSDLWPDL